MLKSVVCALYMIIGMPERNRQLLDALNINHKLYFQAVAVTAASIAAGFVSFVFSNVVLENDLFTSFFIWVIVSSVLFLINRQTVIDQRLEPGKKLMQLWLLRLGTIFMAVTVSLVLAVDTYRDDISRLKEIDIQKANSQLLNSDEYKSKLQLANERIKLEAKALSRAHELNHLITMNATNLADARASLSNELKGAFDPASGRARSSGRGSKAIFHENEIMELELTGIALNNELSRLEDASENLSAAQQSLEKFKNSVTEKATYQFKGKANELRYFFILIKEEPASWLPVSFGLIISIIFEIMLLMALSPSSTLEAGMNDILKLDQKLFQAKLLEFAISQKASLNKGQSAIRIVPPPLQIAPAAIIATNTHNEYHPNKESGEVAA